MTEKKMPLLEARLTLKYGGRKVLDELELTIAPGEILGLVGQSGSGKSTLSLSLMRLIGRRGGQLSGSIRFDGAAGPVDLMALNEGQMRRMRGREIAMVLQSASSALNPALRLEDHFREAWKAHAATPWRDKRPEAIATLRALDLPADEAFLRRFPNEISIGQAQRVLIALALLHQPRLLVADELTSALDLITSAEVLKTLRRVNELWGTSILFVSHDLGSVISLCHRVAILSSGKILESASPSELFTEPQHDYTRQLVQLFENTRIVRAAEAPVSTQASTAP